MKSYRKLFSTLIIFIFCISLAAAQDIPNAGFEEWNNSEPVDWHTTNQPFFNTVLKESDNPQEGAYSALLQVVTVTVPFVGTYSLPGVLSTAEMSVDVYNQTYNLSGGYPFTGMPNKLSGYVKYQPVNNDMCAFGWALSKWQNGTRDTIGFAYQYIAEELSDWTYFEIPIEYGIWEAPDTMNILFLCSNILDGQTHTGTKMWVDNLSFLYGPVGIEGVTSGNGYRVYANGQTRQLILETSFSESRPLTIRLFSINGALLAEEKRSMSHSTEFIDISSLKTGIYVLRIIDGNGVTDTRKITIVN
ncbi:MAG TPA: T9SS type A sorting domain-containing protein [Bacteroidales bacterium]|nr:T9SS type A sorting domain-containing protein [Bacteroidales bacterium]HPT02093.1 T9SS type A sorting domain-containing protein [Bacteroidales bacterium]